MNGVSVSITAYNEENNIDGVLTSVSFANEIILVNSESEDNTVRIAKKYTDKIFTRKNTPNLNVNKNFGFDQASCEWILCLDADEVIPPETADEISKIVTSETEYNGYYIPRKNYYFGKWLKYGGNYPDFQLRLFRKGKGKFPEKHVHERIELDGKTGKMLNPIEHHPYKTVGQYLEKFQFYTDFEANYLFNNGYKTGVGPAFNWMIWKPVTRFIRRYFLKLGMLHGIEGLAASAFDSYGFIIRYLKLRELVNQKGRQK